jgi:3-deoxy-D-manno-octulosonic-acid transferase
VGEAIIAFAVAKELRRKKPGCLIFVTTTTTTGLQRIQSLAAPTGTTIVESMFLAPFDHPFVAGKFIRRIRPNLFILVETELWPSLLQTMRKREIPVAIVNGKLGSRAFRRYRFIQRTMRRIMGEVSLVCVQSRSFARRYRMLGVPPERIEILGNIKFDSLPDPALFKPAIIRATMGIPHEGRVFVAGSTRPGEEEIIAKAFVEVSGCFPDTILIIVPRHLNRVSEVEKILQEAGLSFLRRSSGTKLTESHERVLLLDTMGELLAAYACADAAFVGGSLRDYGGHNPMEPAALGIPVLFGPYMEQTGAKELLSGGAAVLIHNERDFAETVLDLWSNSERRAHVAEAGKQVVAKFKGVLARTMECMENHRLL